MNSPNWPTSGIPALAEIASSVGTGYYALHHWPAPGSMRGGVDRCPGRAQAPGPAQQLITEAMRLSRFFLPVLRETPKEAEIVSHQLMLRSGMVRQSSAGIYSWLPLGFRVLKKIEQIVREEQDRSGAMEMLMPTIQPADICQESKRYDAYGPEMLRFADRHGRDMLYGPTNEELITQIFRD